MIANVPRRQAFTLIELMVVIAIIGLMLGLLLPAVQLSREAARITACSNSLRQFGISTHEYRELNGGYFPYSRITGGYQYRVAPGQKTLGDPGALPERYGLQAVFDQGVIGKRHFKDVKAPNIRCQIVRWRISSRIEHGRLRSFLPR